MATYKRQLLQLIIYPLYLLQLENYELARYWRLLSKKGSLPTNVDLRKPLVWTTKAKMLMFVGFLIHLFVSFLVSFSATHLVYKILMFILTFSFSAFLYPIFFTVSLIFLYPIDYIVKHYIILKAKKHISQLTKLTIIGIAGSFGKTTTKEILATILSKNFSVVKTPESVNTPLGIARLILKELTENTQVFIVEMGEHCKGDIVYLCSIAKPNISILTGINESHLERLHTLETTIATLFEIVENTKETGLVLLNADSPLVKKHADHYIYIKNRKVLWYSAYEALATYQVKNIKFHEDDPGISFDLYHKEKMLGNFVISILGEYIIGIIIASCIIGENLGMSNEEIIKGVKDIKPIPHRLQAMNGQNNILIIDDSYNGNPDGAREAIKVLGKFTSRRKVYITPGLVEMGSAAEAIHQTIGKELSKIADLVILIKNSVTPFVAEGLKQAGFAHDNIKWFRGAAEAHKALPTLLKANDVVMFQNDWGDNYL